jgi:hypothetical protein
MTIYDLVCPGPHVGGKPLLGTAEFPDGVNPPSDFGQGMLCEDCGHVYSTAIGYAFYLAQAGYSLAAGQPPPVDVAVLVLFYCRPVGYVPRYPPGKASFTPNAAWPPTIPKALDTIMVKQNLPRTPRQGPQT